MTYNKVYLDDAVECQGELFQFAYANKHDLVKFAIKYMNSNIREMIDRGYAYYLTMLGLELYEALGYRSITRDLPYDTRSDWFGQFLALLQYHTRIPSKELNKTFDFKTLLSKYNVLHDMDINLAVRKYIEAAGVKHYTDTTL